MRVLHIITGLGLGGAEGVLYRLVLNDKENESIIISLSGESYYSDLFTCLGIKVYYLNMSPKGLNLRCIVDLIILIKKISPDVVQTWMYHANFLGGIITFLFFRKNIFWNLRATHVRSSRNLRFHLFIKLSAILSYCVPCKVICCSESVKLNHEKLGYDKNKTVVINNGYDLERFKFNVKSREAQRSKFKLTDDLKVFGMAARFHPQKDFDNLLKSFQILKLRGYHKFRLLLAGENITTNNTELLKIIKQYDLSENVLLLGIQGNIVEFMNTIDVYVSSSAFGEGFPNVLAEAMACEIPCITTDVGEAKDLVRKEGWVVPTQMPGLLAEAIIKAILGMENKVEWQKRKDECRKIIADNYTLSKMVSEYLLGWSK